MPPAANRLSAESSQRIRDALTETLLRECSDAIEPRLHGAWSLLIEDGCTWKAQARLDNGLLCALRGHFGSNIIREILLAAAGVKISRTCLSDARLELLRGIAEEHGFEIEDKSFPCRPAGETDEAEELIVLVARKGQEF